MKFNSVCLLLMLSASIATILAQPVYENTFCMQRRCPYDGDFRCKSTGNCIRAHLICNGRENCRDGSDEENCGPSYYGCRGFLCDNRTKCISHLGVCNGYESCRDGSDEINCLTEECPFDGDVKCNDTGRCLRSNFICNGFSSCTYGTDEQDCDSRPCPYDSDFRCGDGVCIRSDDVCDRRNNCKDGSDEVNCTYNCPNDDDIMCNSRCYNSNRFCYGQQQCSDVSLNCSLESCPYDGDFRCANGACVRARDVCNGVCQCSSDCSDEDNCTSLNCQSTYLKWCPSQDDCRSPFSACLFSDCGYNNGSARCSDCRNSTRLNFNVVFECDGINDCEDGNDEQNCYERECFAADDFRCRTTGACIRNAQVCDGQQHCSDNSDEENCLLRDCAIPGDIKCRDSGICIHSDMICDGMNDCMDGSDEQNCGARQCPFPGDMRCSSSQACVRSFQWCNNQLDCDDGSDEVQCYDYLCPHAGDFRCHYGGSCIRGDNVCDGTEHCLDGSDEGMNYCPEDFTLGLLWERTLTKTTYEHKCSDIHPSFKFADTITRHCMRNRTWAPVNMSQCVMDSDSPVVMVVIVNMATDNSSLVESKRDLIIQDVKQMIIEHPAVHIDILQSTVNVSLKITYEFSTLTVNELVEVITYDMMITALANISVTTLPQLTVFESTDVCRCPDTMSSSIIPMGVDNEVMVDIRSVCSGKPCDKHCNTYSTCKCIHPFVGDGVVCGKDSDEDGYPDMTLPCDDPHCIQDNCPTVYNPKQNETCGNRVENGTVSTATNANVNDDNDDNDSSDVSAAIGITFVVTLIISVLFTLVIVYIVYKVKTRPAKDEARDTLSMVSKGSTIKANEATYDHNEDYEFLTNTNRPQSNLFVVMQQQPVNEVTHQTDAIYENAK